MTPAPVRLAIVNDFAIVVAGVAQMLAQDARVAVVELDERCLVGGDVDLVLADMFGTVPGDGVDLEDLVASGGAPVVVYSWTTDPAAVAEALTLGASGYLSKALSSAELVDSLLRIHAGQVVTPSATTGEPTQTDGDWPGRDAGLSEREAEILALIAKGRTNVEITDSLFVSLNTVKTHIRHVYARIGVERRAQAVGWALRHGFAPELGRETVELPRRDDRPRPHVPPPA